MDIEEKIEQFFNCKEAIGKLKRDLDLLEYEIMKDLEEQGKTSLHTDAFIAELKTTNKYDYNRLIPLREELPSDVLKILYTPSETRMEKVEYPEKWNMNKGRTEIPKHGPRAEKILESAKIPTTRLNVTKKEEIYDY